MATGGPDLYKVLQVDPEAEDDVVRAAYRQLARRYHPDATGSDPATAERMAAINAAWEVISDPDRRRAYDLERARLRATWRDPERPVSARRAAARRAASDGGEKPREPESTVDPAWTSGRSEAGSGYDAASMRTADTLGAAGPPPGDPYGSVLPFGRYANWSLGEIAAHDPDFLEWLDRMPIGRAYRDEIDALLRQLGRRSTSSDPDRPGLYRRR